MADGLRGTGRWRWAILGLGRAGATVAAALGAAGRPAAVLWDGSAERAEAVSRALGVAVAGSSAPPAALSATDAWLLAVPDGALAGVAQALAETSTLRPPAAVLHLSGALDATPLAPLAARGAETGCLHPACVLPDPIVLPRGEVQAACAARLRGCTFGLLASSGAARDAALWLADVLGGATVELAPTGKVRYHAGCVLASNALVALLDAATRLVGGTLQRPGEAEQLVASLAGSTLAAVAERGCAGALTGPVVRGDVETLAAHLQALTPDAERALYLTLARAALDLARRGPGAGAHLERVARLLAEAGGEDG